MTKDTLKVVFIDWNGTISGSKFWWHLENPLHPHNLLFTKIESTLFGELRPLIKPWMRGETSSEEILKHIATKAKLDYELILKEFIHGCQTMQYSTPKLTHLVKQVQNKGVQVVIATDNMDSFPRWTVPALDLATIFDDILDSHTLKSLKGDFNQEGQSLFFTNYMEKYSLKPGESVLIDDSEDKDNKIGSIGIRYRKIEPLIGLETELQLLINSLTKENTSTSDN